MLKKCVQIHKTTKLMQERSVKKLNYQHLKNSFNQEGVNGGTQLSVNYCTNFSANCQLTTIFLANCQLTSNFSYQVTFIISQR